MRKIERLLWKIVDKHDIRVNVKLENECYHSTEKERFGVMVHYTSYEISLNYDNPLYFDSYSAVKKELKQIMKDGGAFFKKKVRKIYG